MCKENCIMGSTKSNLNSTKVLTCKHKSIMHETLWKCKCNAIHEHITSYKQNLTQKFHKILKDFQNPKKFQENPKPRSKCVKCKKNKRLEKHTRGKMQSFGWNPSREDERVEGKVFGREKEMFLSKRKGEKWNRFCAEAY